MSQFIRFYKSSLEKHPRKTNAIMTGTIFGVGDILAQLLFSRDDSDTPIQPQSSDPFSTTTTTLDTTDESASLGYNMARTLRAVVYGSLIFAPIGDKWMKFLESKIRFVNSKPQSSNNLLRVAVDQLCFAPLSLPFYFGCMTLLELQPPEVAGLKIREQWWSTLLTNWSVWPAIQMVNFSFVPVQHRLLVINVAAMFWNAFLSHKNSGTVKNSEKFMTHSPPVTE